MANETSQVQQNAFASSVEAQLARVEAFYNQLAELETKALEQHKNAIEESARLSRESIAYGATLAAEWRKASLEATRRTFEMMRAPTNPFSSFMG
ncbi:MAG: hypothetical protein HYV09_07220 [Deltaproteobacteria bacterium]|nr:hypothetical protein [Deltaproteobacteria bacterium]